MRGNRLLLLASAFAAVSCSSPVDLSSASKQWDAWPSMSVAFSGNVVLSGTSDVDSIPGKVVVKLVLTNPSASLAGIEMGACSLGVRLYGNSALSGDPMWDNRPPADAACTMQLIIVTVSAGGSATYIAGIIDTPPQAQPFYVAIAYRSDTAVQVVSAGDIN